MSALTTVPSVDDHRRGFTLIELLFCQVLIAGGLAVAWAGGHRYGWVGAVVGFPVGFVGMYLGLFLLVAVGETLWRRGRPFPPCHSGLCQAPSPWRLSHQGEYELTKVDGEWVYRCRCGRDYVRVGRRFMERLPDGTREPYMVHRPFAGWVREREPGA